MFGKHVSPALVDRMLSHDDPLKALDLSGKRAKVTIFYSDIRGFTAMSEKMTPEQIYGQLNEYFEEMCRIVFEHGGYVDKFIGDCLMAVFSAPDPRPGTIDAVEAVESAFRQQETHRRDDDGVDRTRAPDYSPSAWASTPAKSSWGTSVRATA